MVLIKGDYLENELARQAKKIALERSPFPGRRAFGLALDNDFVVWTVQIRINSANYMKRKMLKTVVSDSSLATPALCFN